ncbi:redoxin domain-containing protein [Sphingomonas bacterium]|uniref:redoxin domain-containing protein n=1 Tax=Sphingomonas bacterium TaxID=1895847 RepID=UPI001576B882|nr:redoxin domain-containing protein [Sphingomonas bacterium]
MLTALLVSQVLSWIVIACAIVALLALARQVGVLHMRVAPAGALMGSNGPAVGEAAPHLHLQTIDGQPLEIGGALTRHAMRLLMFVSAECPLCKNLIPAAKSFAKAERIELVFVGDDDVAVQRRMIAQQGIESYGFINGAETGRAFHVDKLPYAVLMDAAGTVLSKGLINSREHLESLIVAHELGMRSVQEYINGLKVKIA